MLPNLVVIGGMKCGTSSLHYYLSLHPEIFMSNEKELNFFDDAWDRGHAWYEAQFPEDAPVRGESSPNYTKYPLHSGVPERMHAVLPNAKLIYVIRDPIERALSHYVDAFSWGRETRSIDDAFETLEGNHYVNCSMYCMQLKRYLAFYPLDQILVLTSESLRQDRVATLKKTFAFLGVDESFSVGEFERLLNRSSRRRRKNRFGHLGTNVAKRLDPSALAVTLHSPLLQPAIDLYVAIASTRVQIPKLSKERRKKLATCLRPDSERLQELTGLDLTSWTLWENAA